jgi:hypothetical protein
MLREHTFDAKDWLYNNEPILKSTKITQPAKTVETNHSKEVTEILKEHEDLTRRFVNDEKISKREVENLIHRSHHVEAHGEDKVQMLKISDHWKMIEKSMMFNKKK